MMMKSSTADIQTVAYRCVLAVLNNNRCMPLGIDSCCSTAAVRLALDVTSSSSAGPVSIHNNVIHISIRHNQNDNMAVMITTRTVENMEA